LLFLMVKLC